MLKKEVEDKIKQYSYKKETLEITLERIEQYEESLKGELLRGYIPSCWHFGESKSDGGLYSSVEGTILSEQEMRKRINEWIEHDRSIAFSLKCEIGQIEKALSFLPEEERYIIDLRYMDKMDWDDVLCSYNKTFKKKEENFISKSTLRNKSNAAIEKIRNLIQPYYSRINYKIS